jgi:hypothetical protein
VASKLVGSDRRPRRWHRGRANPLTINLSAAATDPAEVLSVAIAGVAPDASLSAGVRDANGTYALTPAQLAGLTLTTSRLAQPINLTVTATAVDGGDQSSATSTAAVIQGQANLLAPTLAGAPLQINTSVSPYNTRVVALGTKYAVIWTNAASRDLPPIVDPVLGTVGNEIIVTEFDDGARAPSAPNLDSPYLADHAR